MDKAVENSPAVPRSDGGRQTGMLGYSAPSVLALCTA